MKHPHLTHIARAVTSLDDGSFKNATSVAAAAKSLVYTCLRVVILGGEGVDVARPGSSRLIREVHHFSRKHVRQRLRADFQRLLAALDSYPESLP